MTVLKIKAAVLGVAAAIALIGFGVSTLSADTKTSEIDLTYVWTAKTGMNQQLVATYQAVGEVLDANEPGLLMYEMSVSEQGDQIVIREIFEDADALAFHLTSTAAQYFPQISEIATPGPFIFRGEVPAELKQAAYQMDMGAIFTGDWSGFDRSE